MPRIDALKAKYIQGDLEKEKMFEEHSKRLDTAITMVEFRKQHDLSQRELAEKAGVAKSTITRIENAKVNTSIEMLDRIVNAVD